MMKIVMEIIRIMSSTLLTAFFYENNTVTHHTESEFRSSIGSIFSSKYTSVVKETSVSCADWKFVTDRAGIPKHLSTWMRGKIREREKDKYSVW